MTNDKITFHKATLEDMDTMVEYRIRFALDLGGPQPESVLAPLRAQIKDYFMRATRDNSCISFIARSGDTVAGIGSVIVRETPGSFKNPSGKWGYIMNMYTVPEFRKRGVCSGILTALVEEGSTSGITAFELHATAAGEPVYIQNGFQIHNEPTLRKFI